MTIIYKYIHSVAKTTGTEITVTLKIIYMLRRNIYQISCTTLRAEFHVLYLYIIYIYIYIFLTNYIHSVYKCDILNILYQ